MIIEPYVDTNGVIYKNDGKEYFTEDSKTKYYNYYYSYGRHFKPKNIYEIGVRAGYTAYHLLLGSKAQKFRGIDLETYMVGSSAIALPLIKRVCQDSAIQIGDSHKLSKLDELYNMIHIDGDHSYPGKIQDLELALNNITEDGVIIVDDYRLEVRDATNYIVDRYKLNITVLDTLTVHAILSRRKIEL